MITLSRNQSILQDRLALFNQRQGPRVGDYLALNPPDPRCPSFTRFTHDWGDHIQTGGARGGQYYLSEGGYLSYSGGLDPGIAVSDLVPAQDTMIGSFWFFDEGISGAHRGVTFESPMRVYAHRADARLDGVHELDCPYQLCCLNQEQHDRTCGYWFTVYKHSTNHTAFRLRSELEEWLKKERLELSRPLDNGPDFQFLSWPKGATA